MVFWGALGDAVWNYFSDVKDANPCEDQYMAGVNHQPYPDNPQPYDCGKEYFDGWQSSIDSGHFDSSTTLPYAGPSGSFSDSHHDSGPADHGGDGGVGSD